MAMHVFFVFVVVLLFLAVYACKCLLASETTHQIVFESTIVRSEILTSEMVNKTCLLRHYHKYQN